MVPVLSMSGGDCFGNMGKFLVQNQVSAVASNMCLSRYLLTQQKAKNWLLTFLKHALNELLYSH